MDTYGHMDIRAVTAVLMEGEGRLRSFFVCREDAVRTLFENCLPRVKESLSRIEDVGVLVYWNTTRVGREISWVLQLPWLLRTADLLGLVKQIRDVVLPEIL